MNDAPQAPQRRLAAQDYRHPAETPTLVASLWLAVTALLASEAAMIALVTVARRPTRGVSLVVGVALLALFHAGLVIGLVRLREQMRWLGEEATPTGAESRPDVREAVEEVAGRLGLSAAPETVVLPGDGLRVRCVGLGVPLLVVDEGLLGELLDPLALRAMLARELGHLAAGHVRLRTLLLAPMQERLAHPALMLPLALVWLAMRWWWSVAERTADRAAAIAAGGPEPLGDALVAVAVARAGLPMTSEQQMRRYCEDTFAGRPARLPRAMAGDAPAVDPRRIAELARFSQSEKFGNCLALAGHLGLEPRRWVADPDRSGVAPWAVSWVLAMVWLAVPVALLALGPRPAERAAEAPQVSVTAKRFDPQVAIAKPQPPQVQAPSLQEGDMQQALLDLARMHKERGEYAEARRALEDLILTNPMHVEGHYMLAWVCVALGDKKAARAEFTATMNLAAPDSEMKKQAQAALGRMGG